MIEVHRYQLIVRGAYSKSALRGSGMRPGALLRFKFGDGVIAHADLFPWPALGDAELSDLLHELSQATLECHDAGDLSTVKARLKVLAEGNQRFLLLPRIMDAMEAEADALRAQRPLVAGSVQNHFTALSALQLAPADILDARRGGFPAIKVKISGLLEEAKALGRLQSHWDLPLRLDANENATIESLRFFLDALPIRLRDSIEFIEDPFPFTLKSWSTFHSETGIPIAIDRPVMALISDQRVAGKSLAEVFSEKAAQIYIHKPAWLPEETAKAASEASVPIIVTSALGHPVGNLWAASVAARLAPDNVHGCFTHTVYRDDEISNSLIASKQIRGSRIFGLGLGLGLPAKSLNRIKWEKLA
jgi:O-succinylbenzoate synthase